MTGRNVATLNVSFSMLAKGGEVADLLKNVYSVPFVIFWKTAVRDEAAAAFVDEFYSTLGESRDKSRSFEHAYNNAVLSLTKRKWLVDGVEGDPEVSADLLFRRQKDENDLRLEPAGIPCFYGASDEYTKQMFNDANDVPMLKGEEKEEEEERQRQQQNLVSRESYDELTIFQAAPLVLLRS